MIREYGGVHTGFPGWPRSSTDAAPPQGRHMACMRRAMRGYLNAASENVSSFGELHSLSSLQSSIALQVTTPTTSHAPSEKTVVAGQRRRRHLLLWRTHAQTTKLQTLTPPLFGRRPRIRPRFKLNAPPPTGSIPLPRRRFKSPFNSQSSTTTLNS